MAGSPSRRRELSRMLSRISRADVRQTLAGHGDTATPDRPAYRIGVTGAPGAGKSTLIARLAARRLERTAGEVAVLAIDPTSPITHGSILGDRVRMDAIAGDPASISAPFRAGAAMTAWPTTCRTCCWRWTGTASTRRWSRRWG